LEVVIKRTTDNVSIAKGSVQLNSAIPGFSQVEIELGGVGGAGGVNVASEVFTGTEYIIELRSTTSGAQIYSGGPANPTMCVTVFVDETGSRYLCVRCPEIESYLYRDRAYETVHAGLGMVKLGGYGMREQRYDFVSVPTRRLRVPIGKLRSLTIRLENADGSLYSTMGVDHHLVLAVHYLQVTQDTQVKPSTPLYPNYQPDPSLGRSWT
jgi:hypothetical protein